MSKAVLVMDMPDGCLDCPFKVNMDYCFRCAATSEHNKLDAYRQRADFCPLKELPDPVPAGPADDERYVKGFEAGWNMCLNEIGGLDE